MRQRLPVFAQDLLWKLPTFCPSPLCLSYQVIYGVKKKKKCMEHILKFMIVCLNKHTNTSNKRKFVTDWGAKTTLIRSSRMQCVDIKFLVWGNLKWVFSTFEKAYLWQEIFFELWQRFELLVPHKCLWVFRKSENVQGEIQTLRKAKSLAGDFTGDQFSYGRVLNYWRRKKCL